MEKILINSNYKILDFKYEQLNLYNIIFKFCKDNEILIFNKNINISFLQNKSYNLIDLDNDFVFILFSNSPKKHTIALSNLLFENYSKYVFYTSYIEDKELVISIDNNRLIYFNLLFSSNIDYGDKFNIIKYNKLNDIDYTLLLVPNTILLLFLTHDLYKPAHLLKLIKDNKIATHKNIIHANTIDYQDIKKYATLMKYVFPTIINSKKELHNQFDSNNVSKDSKKYILTKFIDKVESLVTKYSDNTLKNIILLDKYAIDVLTDNKIETGNEILNIIVPNNSNSNKFNIIQYILDILKDILDKENISYDKIMYKKTYLHIYNDFRLKKTNIYILNKQSKQLSLINIFNSADYELIPIVGKYKSFLIPHELVIIRYILLNLITSQLYDSYFNQNTFDKYEGYIYKLCNTNIIHKKIYYTGIYRDEKMDKFKLGSYVTRPLQLKLKNEKK